MRNASLWVLGSMVAFAISLVEPALAQVCTGNTECASPLTCKAGASKCSQSGMVLPDGGFSVGDLVCEPAPSECTWTFVRCQAESECVFPQWTCLAVPDQTLIKTCFPKAIACSAGQTCPTGWSCLDLGEWKDGDQPLKVWKAGDQTQFCWPDSLQGVLDRTAGTDTSGLSLPSAGSNGKASTDEAGTAGPESASKGSGCALGGHPGASSSRLVVLALALVGLRTLSLRKRSPVPGTRARKVPVT